MTEEMEELFKQYIKDNLDLSVDIEYSGWDDRRHVRVSITIAGEDVSSSYDTLPPIGG